jgi:hypothetical protein
MPSTLDEILKQIFKEQEEWHQDWQCENTDSDSNSDVLNANHSRPLTRHKEAIQCMFQLITHSSAHQPKFMDDLYYLYNGVLGTVYHNLRCWQHSTYFSPNEWHWCLWNLNHASYNIACLV